MARLYALLDPDALHGRDPVAFAAAVLRGGAAHLQLRAKHDRDAETLALGRALRPLCTAHGARFVVNDRADLAALLEADGLHLGQEDLPIEQARGLVGTMPISLSTHDPEQARDAVRRGAQAIGFGPVFPTRSKADPDPVVGLEALAAVVAESPVPVVAIGGIDLARAEAVAATGVAFVAVISALASAPDPEAAARALCAALESGARRVVRRAPRVTG